MHGPAPASDRRGRSPARLAGVGLVVLFRHGSSLGGFAVLALECQDRFGWRAGYVQLACDDVVLLLSVAGAGVLNMVLALNHRPGRYLGV